MNKEQFINFLNAIFNDFELTIIGIDNENGKEEEKFFSYINGKNNSWALNKEIEDFCENYNCFGIEFLDTTMHLSPNATRYNPDYRTNIIIKAYAEN